MSYLGTKPQTATTLADNIVTADKIVSGAVTDAKIAAMAATKLTGVLPDANAPSGSVIQVVSTSTNGSFSTSSQSFVDITGMSVTITPSSSSNRILITGHMQVGGSDDGRYMAYKLLRNSTSVAEGDKGGNNGTNAFLSSGGAPSSNRPYTNENMAFTYVDSPNTTSAVTYKLQVNPNVSFSGRIFYLNRPQDLADNLRIWTVSTITVMEIAA